MITTHANAEKRLLLTIWLALLGTLAVYVAATYLVPGGPKPQAPQMRVFLGVLQVVAAVEFLVGMVMERIMVRRAGSAGEVVKAGIVSAAIGEAIGLYGLVWFCISRERVWAFFIVSGLYFLRLFMRLPEFNAKIDSLCAPE
jgi:F0F1-type ATP synthase membrane subunit c/vacuolar-type H+-ATPase subunit K